MPKFATNAQYQRNRAHTVSLLRELRVVLARYRRHEGTTARSALRDALIDLRHLADVWGLDFGKVDEDAHRGYVEESAAEWRESA